MQQLVCACCRLQTKCSLFSIACALVCAAAEANCTAILCAQLHPLRNHHSCQRRSAARMFEQRALVYPACQDLQCCWSNRRGCSCLSVSVKTCNAAHLNCQLSVAAAEQVCVKVLVSALTNPDQRCLVLHLQAGMSQQHPQFVGTLGLE
jgi:hypothetical protein